jgi:hypothetical protein
VITQIVPVLVRDDWRAVLLWKALYDAGVYVNVAIYPAVQRGGALLRTSVMATHEVEHLDRALAVFERVKDEVERMVPPDLGPPAGRRPVLVLTRTSAIPVLTAVVVAPVKIGRDAYTGAGSAITRDVPPGALAVERAEQRTIPGYAERKAKNEDDDIEDSG